MKRSDYECEEPEELFFSESMMLSWDIYCAMSTQWRIGSCGATGLDYNVLPFMFDVFNVKEKELTLSDLRVLESKAIEMMSIKK